MKLKKMTINNCCICERDYERKCFNKHLLKTAREKTCNKSEEMYNIKKKKQKCRFDNQNKR